MLRQVIVILILLTFFGKTAVCAELQAPATKQRTDEPAMPASRLAPAAGNVYGASRPALPDLQIKQYLFPPANDKALRVHIVNSGNSAAGACRLLLTVRKINGVAVGRTTHVNVAHLPAGKDAWVLIDAKAILPKNISLESTTFKLNVDATQLVNESDETNNEVWHNL